MLIENYGTSGRVHGMRVHVQRALSGHAQLALLGTHLHHAHADAHAPELPNELMCTRRLHLVRQRFAADAPMRATLIRLFKGKTKRWM